MLKKTIYENITLGVDATFDDGKKIKGSIAFLTKDYNIELTEDENNKQFILAKEEFVVEVKDYRAEYKFIIKELIDKYNINQKDITYVKGWMDSDGDDKYNRLYDLEVFLEVCTCEIMFSKISAIVLKNEGGYVNNLNDKGGATNYGITWNTWQKYSKSDLGIEPTLENLKNLSDKNAEKIYFKRYWEPKGFCKIKDIKVALMIYDWTITSGGAISQVQKLLNSPKYNNNLSIDNGLGENTINAINNVSKQDVLLNDIATIRKKYYYDLSYDEKGNPKIDKFGRNQSVFYKGWINRVNTVLGVKF